MTETLDRKKVLNALFSLLQSPVVSTPQRAAKVALDAVRNVVANERWKVASDLIEVLSPISRQLLEHKSTFAPFARNVVLRCLKVIRDGYKVLEEEIRAAERQTMEDPKEGGIVTAWDAKPTYEKDFSELKERVLDEIDELASEIDLNTMNIANQAVQHIHANDVVLTFGYSSSAEVFLKGAWKKGRLFHVVVVEGGSEKTGHRMAESLASEGIEVTLIPDSSVFAVMSNVTKVVLGTYLLLSNGGLRASSGTYPVCLAASHYAVPVLVCSSSFELVPEYPGFAPSMNFYGGKPLFTSAGEKPYDLAPDMTMPYYLNPIYDYVPPELVSILIFSSGGNVPSYMYSVRKELYGPEDVAWEIAPDQQL